MIDYKNKIKNHYDKNPEREWERLDVYGIEFPVTLYYLDKYIKPESKILDIGGGPGRYSFELVKKGHSVILTDLSEGNINIARKKQTELDLKLDGCLVRDALNLSDWDDDTFDAVLNFGPVYHSQNQEDREKIVREALRVLKPGGIAAFAFLSIYGPVFDLVKKNPQLIIERYENLKSFIMTGLHTQSDVEPGFTDIYMIDPMKISDFFENFNIELETIIGAEGLTSQSEENFKELKDEHKQKWIDFSIDIADTIGALNCSEHIVYFGRKKKYGRN